MLFHVSIVPARTSLLDLGMLIPIVLCLGVGCLVPSYRLRLIFGFSQAVLLLHVFSNYFTRELRFGNPLVVYVFWVAWVSGYTASFMLFTHILSPKRPGAIPGCCCGCGYDLRGLKESRCPECGRHFLPEEQHPSSPNNATTRQTQKTGQL